jgi:hypothetical protein
MGQGINKSDAFILTQQGVNNKINRICFMYFMYLSILKSAVPLKRQELPLLR